MDRAGFQLAAVWLGAVDRIWWLYPGQWGGPTSDATWTIKESPGGWPEREGEDEGEDDDEGEGEGLSLASLASHLPRGSAAVRTQLAVKTGPLNDLSALRTWLGPHQPPTTTATRSRRSQVELPDHVDNGPVRVLYRPCCATGEISTLCT